MQTYDEWLTGSAPQGILFAKCFINASGLRQGRYYRIKQKGNETSVFDKQGLLQRVIIGLYYDYFTPPRILEIEGRFMSKGDKDLHTDWSYDYRIEDGKVLVCDDWVTYTIDEFLYQASSV